VLVLLAVNAILVAIINVAIAELKDRNKSKTEEDLKF
jgi:hypothetical protein